MRVRSVSGDFHLSPLCGGIRGHISAGFIGPSCKQSPFFQYVNIWLGRYFQAAQCFGQPYKPINILLMSCYSELLPTISPLKGRSWLLNHVIYLRNCKFQNSNNSPFLLILFKVFYSKKSSNDFKYPQYSHAQKELQKCQEPEKK